MVCTAEQCTYDLCGQQANVIGYKETEILDVRPAEFFVTVIKREKQGVATAAVPERIVSKLLLFDRWILDLVVGKYMTFGEI